MMKYLWRYLITYHAFIWGTLLGLAWVTSRGIIESVANIPNQQVFIMVIVALILGASLAISRFPTWLSALTALLVGAEYLLLVWGPLGRPIGNATVEVVRLVVQFVRQLGREVDLTAIQIQFAEITAAGSALLARSQNWISNFGTSLIIDPLIPQLIWGFAIWLAIIFLSWAAWKHYPAVIAMSPAGFLLATAAFFSDEVYGHLAAFLCFTFLLQFSGQALSRQNRWERLKIDYAPNLAPDLFSNTIPVAILIALMAFYVPSFSITRLSQTIANMMPWQSDPTEAIASSFGLDQAQSGSIDRAGLNGLPNSHLLGNNPELSSQLVMTVRTGEVAPAPVVLASMIEFPRHYWQAATYERYTSFGWIFSADDSAIINPDETLGEPSGPGRELTQQVVRGPNSRDLLHTSGDPLSVDKPIDANYRSGQDLVAARVEDESYTATSWILEPTPAELRASGTDYPTEIVLSYLSLPRSLPDRVRNLALQITATQPTPYDKALALEAYLRQFPYNLEVERPPSRTDVADYFLFDVKEGYCDYYATSMVVMARAIGIPARFTIGYVTGFYDVELAEYRVSEAEAHSWPQIYFPDIGWVNFEPTAGRPEIVRNDSFASSSVSNETNADPSLEEPEDVETSGSAFSINLDSLTTVHPFWWGLLVLIGGFVVTNFDYWRIRRLKQAALVETLYHRLVDRAAKLGVGPSEGTTPYEFARQFVRFIETEIPKSRLARLRYQAFWRLEIHAIDEPSFQGIQKLAQAFVRQQYAPPETATLDKDDLLDIWDELNPNLKRANLIIRLTRRFAGLFRK